jgi:hypothetical protein
VRTPGRANDRPPPVITICMRMSNHHSFTTHTHTHAHTRTHIRTHAQVTYLKGLRKNQRTRSGLAPK